MATKPKNALGENTFLSKTDPLKWMNVNDDDDVVDTAYGRKKADNVVMIPLDSIIPNPKNYFSQTQIEELAEDIEENGLQHNLVVRPINDGELFQLIGGHRRWAACKHLAKNGNEKFNEVMCQVIEVDDMSAEIMMINDNIKTRTISPLEKIESIKRLSNLINEKRNRGEYKGQKTRDLVGEIIGVSGVEITRLNQVSNNLVPELMSALDEGKITLRSAIELASKPADYQRLISEKVTNEESLSTNDVGKIITLVDKKEAAKLEGVSEELKGEDKPACSEGEKWATSIQKTMLQLDKQVQQLITLRSRNPEAYNDQKDSAARICQKINELKVTLENALIESAKGE